jgi:hypothetical protein
MRYAFASLMLAVVCQGSFAQQHVVRNSSDPKNRERRIIVSSCTSVGLTQPGDPCDVEVYNTKETQTLIEGAKKDVIDQTALQINAAKIELSKDINKIPAAAVDALRAQIKEEIKAEVIKELIEEIKAGKLKIVTEEPPKKMNR